MNQDEAMSAQERHPWTVYLDGELFDVLSDGELAALTPRFSAWRIDPNRFVASLVYKGEEER